ncbi:MAG: hypothetical protein ACJ8C4_14725 [Gemmataceae bacterium]
MKTPPDELLSKLHGVTGPELSPVPPESPLAWWIAISLSGVLFAGIVIFWPRRRRTTPNLPPGAEARAALSALPTEPTAEALAALDQLSRRYIVRVHGVDALRLTTPELLVQLPTDIATEWRDVLDPCDRARFAGVLPTQAAWSELVQRAQGLVQTERKKDEGGRMKDE